MCARGRNADECRLSLRRACNASSGSHRPAPQWHALFKKTAHVRRCAIGKAASARTTMVRKWRARVIGHARAPQTIAPPQGTFTTHTYSTTGEIIRPSVLAKTRVSSHQHTFRGVQFTADHLLDDEARHVVAGFTICTGMKAFFLIGGRK